jgi:hypothetical protein
MPLTLPGWYNPARSLPDVEKDVLRPLFQPILTGSNVDVVSWIPIPDVYNAKLAAGGGYLRTYRTGGAWNEQQKRDEPRVQVAALMPSRDESCKLINFVRAVLISLIRETGVIPGTTIELSAEGEVAGPQIQLELLQDDKLVPITWQLFTKQGVPDYRAALNLTNL